MKKSSEKSHCSVRMMPVPSLESCPSCGYELELWSDEEESQCPACGWNVFRKEGNCAGKAGLLSTDIS